MTTPYTVCYYVSGHGYGHAIRTVQVLRVLPPDVRVIVKTTAPERLFREELPGRPVEVVPAEYDCGAVQRDSISVEPRQTLDRYADIARRNQAHLAEEVAFLRRENVRVVASDVPSFPLRAAREAGAPGVVVTNFTWADIYRDYVETDDDARLVQSIRDEYAQAALALVTPLALPGVTEPFSRVEHIPLIARRGARVRPALEAALGSRAGTHLALLYLGVWGMPFDWPALAAFPDWTFLTYDAPPAPVQNVVRLDPKPWPYAGVMASVDAVISKPGYGTVTECIANSVPFVYVPRQGFAEQDALVAGMAPWGGGVRLSEADFLAGRWGDALRDALEAHIHPDVYGTGGARAAAERLLCF